MFSLELLSTPVRHSVTMSKALKHGVRFADIVNELKIQVSIIPKLSVTLSTFITNDIYYSLIQERHSPFSMYPVSVSKIVRRKKTKLKIWHCRCSVRISIWKSIVWTFKLMKRLQIKICQLFLKKKLTYQK